jgi:putative protein kinase ArgK-like GTPase of G3E family
MLADLPVAILLNKCDMPNAMTSRVKYANASNSRPCKMQGHTKLQIFRISVLKGEGYQEAFDGLVDSCNF